jgi:hypothetical protein
LPIDYDEVISTLEPWEEADEIEEENWMVSGPDNRIIFRIDEEDVRSLAEEIDVPSISSGK